MPPADFLHFPASVAPVNAPVGFFATPRTRCSSPARNLLMPRYDAIVIGSGQAGNPLCFRLAAHGGTVALIEKDQLGGPCVNPGCTPTKTLGAPAQVAHSARQSSRWG